MGNCNANRPNILFIMSDDHGYWAMGSEGNQEIRTPNLDKLAEKGIKFNNFFCASPVCSPARASIMTGKIPSQHGIHDWIAGGHMDESKLSQELKEKLYDENAPEHYNWAKDQMKGSVGIEYLKDHKCYTEYLKDAGYTCGLSGKWHMGDSGKVQGGFDYFKTLALGGDNYYYATVLDGEEFVMKEGTYVTDYITEHALEFIESERDKDKPFYLSVHYTAPHSPWGREHHPQEFYKMYETCVFDSVPKENPHPWSPQKNMSKEKYDVYRLENLRGYYTAVTAMDYGIGQILDSLEEQGILDNTIIIFTSDNGMSMGHHGIFGKGNGTFPLNMYDTAVKVPMIIYNPLSEIQEHQCQQLLSHYDIFPTLLELLNIEDSCDYLENLPGNSFAPLLKGEEIEFQEDVVIMDEYGPTRMIRTKEYKYIHRYPYGTHELYDLKKDADEKNNLAGEEAYREVEDMLRARLEAWFDKYIVKDLDGLKAPVYGRGQIEMVGKEGKGKKAFRTIKVQV